MSVRIYLKEILLVVLFAVLFSLPFHFPHLYFLSFVAFVPLLWALKECSSVKEVLGMSYLAGLLQTALTYYWILHVTKFGYLAMCVYLGLFVALFGFLAHGHIVVLSRGGQEKFANAWLKLLTVSALWVLVEFARGNMPIMRFPWALLGYSQWKNQWFIQSAEWVGPYGVSFVVVIANVMIFALASFGVSIIKQRATLLRGIWFVAWIIGIGASVLLANIGYGYHYFNTHRPKARHQVDTYRLSLIQGNIPQEDKWNEKIQSMIYNKYDGLTRQIIMDEPNLAIWPETAFPGYWGYERDITEKGLRLATQIDTDLLIGAPTFRLAHNETERMNSAIYVSRAGREIKRHHKVRLVPFGEYIPFFQFLRNFFGDIGRFSPGTEMTLFDFPVPYKTDQDAEVSSHKGKNMFGVLICFEDIFPDYCRIFVRKGAKMLVNITNDAWFKNSSGPYQHAQNSVFRAVENRVPVVRAANTGLSCFINERGEIYSSVQQDGKELLVTGFVTDEVTIPKNQELTFYNIYGDYVLYILLVFWFITYPFHLRHISSPAEDLPE